MADESLIDGGRGHRAQRRRVKKTGWTKGRRTAFLKSLAETCNVKLSVARTGMSCTGAYDLRRRDPSFAQLWDDALAIGYDRLETLLLQRALEGVNDIDVAALCDEESEQEAANALPPHPGPPHPGPAHPGPAHPGSGISAAMPHGNAFQLALALLNRRGARDGLRAGPRKLMSADEVDALLVKKLDALSRQRADDDGKAA